MSMLPTRQVRGYGWRPQLPDARDRPMLLPAKAVSATTADLRPKMPPVYDQAQLGSCTANAIGAAWEYEGQRQGLKLSTPSRLFIYYGEREIEGDTQSDNGAEIRDGIKVVAKLGAPPETDWPYSDANPGPFQQRPPAKAYTDASQHVAIKYFACQQDASHIRWCLSHGYPVVFGFTVYDSFESQQVANTGVVPMPDVTKEHVVGGHAVVAVGYNATDKMWHRCPPRHYIVRNSWGVDWGDAGCCYMPDEILDSAKYSSDLWTIRAVK